MPIPVNATPVPMTDEQRFVYDLKGWLLIPAVLEPELLQGIREYLQRISENRAALGARAASRLSLVGPSQALIDHPAVVGILREIIAPDPSPNAYGFRCESSFFINRRFGQAGFQPPHRGPADSLLEYRCSNNRIWSGLTRVVWELTEITQREGGTPVMSGSHKSNFSVPPAYRRYDPSLYEGYTCPAGSVLIFSESCWHYGAEWKDPKRNRLAVFNCYNSYLSQWHKMNIDPDIVAAMPAMRQTAFRGVWARDMKYERNDGKHLPGFVNDFHAPENSAL